MAAVPSEAADGPAGGNAPMPATAPKPATTPSVAPAANGPTLPVSEPAAAEPAGPTNDDLRALTGALLRPEREWAARVVSSGQPSAEPPPAEGRISAALEPASQPQPAKRPQPKGQPGWPALPEWRPAQASSTLAAAAPNEGSSGPGLPAVVGGAGLAVVILLIALGLDLGPQAGAVASPTPERRTAAVAGLTSFEETFDAFPMRSRLPDPWTVRGDGPVEIAALPTSVDRSVRIASGLDGSMTEACLPIGVAAGGAVRVALDYRLGRSPTTDVTLLTLGTEGSEALTVVLPAAGGPIQLVFSASASGGAETGQTGPPAAPGGSGADASTAWQRVDLSVSPVGEVTWLAYDGTGADAGSGSASAPDLASRALDTLCLRSPAGAPSGWTAIDDLLIQS